MFHPHVTHELEPKEWNMLFWNWLTSVQSEGSVMITLLSVLECLNAFLFMMEEDSTLQELPMSYRRQFNREAVIDEYWPQRLHNWLFQTPWPDEYFDPTFLKHFREGSLREITNEIYHEVFTSPIFSTTLCAAIIEEMENFTRSGLPVSRPNSMNNYGLIINNMGLEPSMKWLQETYLWPIARIIFSNTAITSRFDSHHSFIVHYQPGKDLGLDMHMDDSDITFNICLGKEFEGAALNFCGVIGQSDHRQFKTEFHHVKGSMVVHLGRQRHGACEITSGERLNLIIWNKNQIWRMSKNQKNILSEQKYSKEGGPPDLRCLSYTHDKDYAFFKKKKVPDHIDADKVQFAGWCPPEHAWYDEFTDERKKLGLK